MKLDRTAFPPLTKEDYLCEYYLTPETAREFMEIMKMPADQRPGKLRIKVNKRYVPKPK